MYNSALLHPHSSSSLCLAQGRCVTRVLLGTMYRVLVPSIISNFKRGQGSRYRVEHTNRRNGRRDQMRKQREGAGRKLDLAWLRTSQYYLDPKYSCSCLEEYFDPKYSSAGRIRAFFARLIFWRVIFSGNPPREKLFFPSFFLTPPPKYFLKNPTRKKRPDRGQTILAYLHLLCCQIFVVKYTNVSGLSLNTILNLEGCKDKIHT